MKFLLQYNYNLGLISLYTVDGIVYVVDSFSERYMLVHANNVDEVIEIDKILKNYNLSNLFYDIIFTFDNKIGIIYNDYFYVLLKIKKINRDLKSYSFNKITLNNNNYILRKDNWVKLWLDKDEYLYNKWCKLRNKNKFIDESFDYFYGLSMCAITYLKCNNINSNSDNKLTLCYRRFFDKEIYNPLNLIIDVPERNISEYFKYMFFNNCVDYNIIENILNDPHLNIISYNKIYGRLLYPNYYFDMCEFLITDIIDDKKFVSFVSRVNKYEEFLNNVYKIMICRYKIKKVEWL